MKAISGLAQGAALIVLATPGFAQITAEDVWANQSAYLDALGVLTTSTMTRNGQIVTVSGIEMTYTLPMGIGTLFVRTGDMTLTENADGTVDVGYPANSTISVGGNFDIDGETGAISADFGLHMTDYMQTAAGVPGDITYTSSIGLVDLSFDDVTLTPDPDLEPYELTAYVTVQGITSTTRVVEGDIIRIETNTESGATVYDIQYSDNWGTSFSTVGAATTGASMGTVLLPRTPLDPLNVSTALRNGLSLDLSSLTTESVSRTVMSTGHQIVSDQRQNVDTATQTFRLDQNRMVLEASADGVAFDIPKDASIPFPVAVSLDTLSFNLQVPVSASPQLQPVNFRFGMRGLGVNDEVWNMVDPSATLPREPVNLGISLDADVLNRVDLFNFMALPAIEDQINAGQMPVELHRLTISGIDGSALGVSANGQADCTFDNSDLFTFGGLPRPTGTGAITVTGANALIDKLASMGILAPSDISAARMGIAMFAETIGDDQLRASIELTADGQLMVNGQRMQ